MSNFGSLGLRDGEVVLEKHNPEWRSLFEQMKQSILRFGDRKILQVDHIGSTAIPDLSAKPVLDILLAVDSFKTGLELVPAMEENEFVYHGENGLIGRHFFTRTVSGLVVAHIHIIKTGIYTWERHIAFRDYLLSHPGEVTSYERIKNHLAIRYRNNRDAYQRGKQPFIRRIEKLATGTY